MKILVLNNTNIDKKDFKKSSDYFISDFVKKIIPNGIKIEFEFERVNVLVKVKRSYLFNGFNRTTGKPEKIWLYSLTNDIRVFIKNKVSSGLYDIIIFVWDMDSIPLPPDGTFTSLAVPIPLYKGTEYIQLAINNYTMKKTWIKIIHEMMHIIAKPFEKRGIRVDEMDKTKNGIAYYKNDNPYAKDGNFSITLKNLKPHLQNSTYKWFSQREIDKLKIHPMLLFIINEMRDKSDTAYIGTSGFRTVAQNKKVGGAKNSAHLRRLAIDLRIMDNLTLTRMLYGISVVRRKYPVFLEITKTHLHIDIDSSIHSLDQTIIR